MSHDLKVLHIRSSYFYGGPERQIRYLNLALQAKGIDCGIASFAPRSNPSANKYIIKAELLGSSVYRIDIDGSFDRKAISSLEKIVIDNGFNFIIAHDYRADYCALQLRKRLNIPAISFSRGWTRNSFKVRLYEWLDRRFLKKMDGVVAVSQSKFEELSQAGLSDDRLIYIPNSIPVENVASRQNLIRDRLGIPNDAVLFGTAGRLSIEKSQEIFIKAAIKVLSENRSGPSIYFIIAGEGVRKQFLKSLIPEEFTERIILAGWVEDNDAFYADLDCFVLTSATEGFPNVLLEAGKYSIPAISTPAGGAVEIIEDGQSGLMIDFNDVDRLTKNIIDLASDADRRKLLGDNLNRITRDKFDSSLNAERVIDFIKRIRKAQGDA